jgi:hypothetical protein
MRLKKRKDILKTRAIILLIFINIFLIGAVINLLTISENGGKMPVYTNRTVDTDERHFLFNESEQVEMFIFTDILHMSFTNLGFEIFFSIGDVIIYISGLAFFISGCIFLFLDIRYLYKDFMKCRQ